MNGNICAGIIKNTVNTPLTCFIRHNTTTFKISFTSTAYNEFIDFNGVRYMFRLMNSHHHADIHYQLIFKIRNCYYMDIFYSITIITNTLDFLYFAKITKINVFPIYLE
jgi:hypothetical protein